MKNSLFSVFVVFLVSACASPGPIMEIGEREKEVINKVQKRLEENQPKVEEAAATLGELGAAYTQLDFELELALAKAKRLESMQSFLASAPKNFRITQRAVVLYHLYEVEQAEQKVLEARMAMRRASVKEISAAYAQLQSLLDSAASNLEIILEHLNRPRRARILAFTENFLAEVKSFRETLETSSNPRLKKLAADVAQFEGAANEAKADATKAMQAFTTLTGG